MALTTSHLWLCSALHRNMVSKEAIVTALKQEARNPCDLLASFPGTFSPCSWVPGNEASDLRISIRATDELYCYMNCISPSYPTGRISVRVTHDLLTLWVCKGTRWGAGGSRDCSCPRRSKKPSALHLTNSLQRSQTTNSVEVAMLRFVFVFSLLHLEKIWQGLRRRKSFWANKPRGGWLTEQVSAAWYSPISLSGCCTW